MLALPLLALAASAAEEYSSKLPSNMSLVVPLSSEKWREGFERTSKALGGRVGGVVLFASEADAPAFGPITNTLARQLRGERAVYVGAVLDADGGTIGDDKLSLPHVLLLLPGGGVMPWAEWLPNMFTPQDRIQVAKSLASWRSEVV